MQVAMVAAVAAVAGAVVAVAARDRRAVALGLLAALLVAPLATDPLPSAPSLVARVAGAMLAAELLWVATRIKSAPSEGSAFGLTAEAAIAAAAFAIGMSIAPVAPLPGPLSEQAAGLALVALSVGSSHRAGRAAIGHRGGRAGPRSLDAARSLDRARAPVRTIRAGNADRRDRRRHEPADLTPGRARGGSRDRSRREEWHGWRANPGRGCLRRSRRASHGSGGCRRRIAGRPGREGEAIRRGRGAGCRLPRRVVVPAPTAFSAPRTNRSVDSASPRQRATTVTLAAFFAACAVGAGLGLLTRAFRRLGPIVGLAGLATACVAALLIGSSEGVTIGEVRLSGSAYAGAFLACGTGTCLLLYLVGLGSSWPDRLVPAALAAFGGLGLAFAAADPAVALGAAAAAATTGAVVSSGAGTDPEERAARLSEARTLALLVGSLLFAAIAVSRPSWVAQDGPVLVLAFLALATALATRSGAIPFHLPAARLGRRGPSTSQALVLIWIPAGIGVLAVSWSATTFGVRSDWLDLVATTVQIVAIATLVLGAVGALLHDDVTEIAVYSIVADSGFILLALASRDEGAAEPARLWLLVFIAAKTAFVAWAAAASQAFGSSSLGELRGWLRRTPILGLALVAIAAATLGWPGSAVYEARSTLVSLALPDRLHFLSVVAIVLSLAYFGRLLLVGLLSPVDAVAAAAGERPRWLRWRGTLVPGPTRVRVRRPRRDQRSRQMARPTVGRGRGRLAAGPAAVPGHWPAVRDRRQLRHAQTQAEAQDFSLGRHRRDMARADGPDRDRPGDRRRRSGRRARLRNRGRYQARVREHLRRRDRGGPNSGAGAGLWQLARLGLAPEQDPGGQRRRPGRFGARPGSVPRRPGGVERFARGDTVRHCRPRHAPRPVRRRGPHRRPGQRSRRSRFPLPCRRPAPARRPRRLQARARCHSRTRG